MTGSVGLCSPTAYHEWVGSDNDIYDEVFADVYPAR